jgi:hypothetical protein
MATLRRSLRFIISPVYCGSVSASIKFRRRFGENAVITSESLARSMHMTAD